MAGRYLARIMLESHDLVKYITAAEFVILLLRAYSMSMSQNRFDNMAAVGKAATVSHS